MKELSMQPYDSSVISTVNYAPQRRPPGVVFVAWLTFLLLALNMVRLVQIFTTSRWDWILVLGWIPVCVVLVLLLIGIGLWKLQDWARRWGVYLYGFLVLWDVYKLYKEQADWA